MVDFEIINVLLSTVMARFSRFCKKKIILQGKQNLNIFFTQKSSN